MTEDIFEHLGVPRIVNAAGGFTAYGGSRMLPSTIGRMSEVAESYTDIRLLQTVVHRDVWQSLLIMRQPSSPMGLMPACTCAQLQRWNAALTVQSRYLSQQEISSYEVVVFASHHNPYDFVLHQLGVRTKILGFVNFIEPITSEMLEHNITDRTVAIFFFQAEHGWATQGGLPFDSTITISKAFNLPIIVDCTAQLPPKENLWKFTQAGATAALFSGSKDLRGPQSSGLVLGQHEFLNIVTRIGFPNYGHGAG